MELKNKKIFILGERDGVQGEAITECIKGIGADIIFVDTQCFV